MTDFKPSYESDLIKIFEYPQPICAIVDKNHGVVDIRTPEDAKAVIQSLIAFLNAIPYEFGGYGEPKRAYTGTGSDYLDCVLGVGGFEQYGPIGEEK